MTNHANKQNVIRMSMPKPSCVLDRLEGHKVGILIKKICALPNLTVTDYDQSKEEQSHKHDETPLLSALCPSR